MQNGVASDLKSFPDKGKPPVSRLGNAQSAITIFNTFWSADRLSAANRASVDLMLGGAPPYDAAMIQRSGNKTKCNLNFGEGAAIVDAELASYNDLLESVGCMVHVSMPEAFDPAERPEIEDIISEEFDRMMRKDWKEFDRSWQVLSSQFVKHGVGLLYYADSEDWKFRTGGWDDFLIPRDTEACEESIDVMVIIRSYTASELYKKIRNEKQAEIIGWNVDAVKETLVLSTGLDRAARPQWENEWAKLARRLKNNDLSVSHGEAEKIEILHFWVREFDGSYSHFMVPRNARKEVKFLYKKMNAASFANEAFILFTNGIGNGFYHSIRGKGYEIYPKVQELNRVRCRTVDQAMLAGSILLQPSDTTELEGPPLRINGLVGYLDPNIKVVDNGLKTRAQELIELGREMSLLTQTNSTGYRSSFSEQPASQTRYQIMAQQDLESRLSTSQANLFYRSWGKATNESFRRVQVIGEKNARYPEVKAFYERCMERGVLPEMVKAAVSCEPQRAIGLGSPAQRQQAFLQLEEMQGGFDERGRKLLLRDRISAIPGLGRSYADRYAPRDEGARPLLDEQFAQLENAAMKAGQKIQRTEGQNDVVHANIHLPTIIDSIKGLEQMRSGGEPIDTEAVLPELRFLDSAIAHTNEHVEMLKGDPMREPEYGAFRKALQEMGAIFTTFVTQVNKLIKKEQEQNDAQAQPDQERSKEIAEFQQKLQMLWEEHQARLQMSAQQVAQKLKTDKMIADQKLAIKSREARMKIETQQAKPSVKAA